VWDNVKLAALSLLLSALLTAVILGPLLFWGRCCGGSRAVQAIRARCGRGWYGR
jgi:hypothetical protein